MKPNQRKKREFPPGPKPHGAIRRCTAFSNQRSWPQVGVAFSATVAGDSEFPVHFYELKNLRQLHNWLGEVISIAEERIEGK